MYTNSLNEDYYTTIDFNEVDIRIYLPEKVNITFKEDKSFCYMTGENPVS